MTPEQMVDGVINLISLPEICIRVNTLLEDPNHTHKQLGELIGHDPALTARILRIVNSAYYNFPSKIELVSRAISIIGEHDLRTLVLATSAVDVFKRIPNQLVNMELFWQHSVFTGIVARLLSKHCHVLHSERLFIAGLLHDIGKLILYYKEPTSSQQVLVEASEHDGLLVTAEQKILGFTHADVGGALIEAWKLPESLYTVVRYHHNPEQANAYELETALVHMANAIVNSMEPGIEIDEHLLDESPEFNPVSLDITGIKLGILPELMAQAHTQTHEVLNIMFPAF